MTERHVTVVDAYLTTMEEGGGGGGTVLLPFEMNVPRDVYWDRQLFDVDADCLSVSVGISLVTLSSLVIVLQ